MTHPTNRYNQLTKGFSTRSRISSKSTRWHYKSKSSNWYYPIPPQMNLPKNATSQRLFVFAGANDDDGFDSFSDRSHGDFSDPFPAAICFVWYRSTSFFRREIQWRERERGGYSESLEEASQCSDGGNGEEGGKVAGSQFWVFGSAKWREWSTEAVGDALTKRSTTS